MKELIKSRKQLKGNYNIVQIVSLSSSLCLHCYCCIILELKLKQSEKGQGDINQLLQSCPKPGHDQKGSSLSGLELQQLHHNGNAKPKVEETVNIITNRLKERRRELELPENLKVCRGPIVLTCILAEIYNVKCDVYVF